MGDPGGAYGGKGECVEVELLYSRGLLWSAVRVLMCLGRGRGEGGEGSYLKPISQKTELATVM